MKYRFVNLSVEDRNDPAARERLCAELSAEGWRLLTVWTEATPLLGGQRVMSIWEAR